MDLYTQAVVNGTRRSLLGAVFLFQDISERTEGSEPTAALVKLSGNINQDRGLINALSMKTKDGIYQIDLHTAYSGFTEAVSSFKEIVLPVIAGAAVVLAIFSALMMTNFLTVSVDYRKREIGILRAIGARKRDAVGICLSESLIIAGIVFVLALISVFVISSVVNTMIYRLPVFIVGFIPIMSMFLLCFGVACISTIFPVRRVTSKKPVDIIREN